VRGHRQIALSPAGERYFAEVSEMLARLRDVTQNISAAQPAFNIRVAVPPTFAARWLIPHLQPFHAAEPRVSVQLTAPTELVGEDDVDVDIRFGNGRWPGCRAVRLVRNVVTPVCSPEVQARCIGLPSLEALRGHTLLYSLTRSGDWFSWLNRAGASAATVQSVHKLGYESSTLVYQAAACNLGVAIAQLALVSRELKSGDLVTPFDLQLDMGDATYYLVVPRSRKKRVEVRRFTDWLEALSEPSI